MNENFEKGKLKGQMVGWKASQDPKTYLILMILGFGLAWILWMVL